MDIGPTPGEYADNKSVWNIFSKRYNHYLQKVVFVKLIFRSGDMIYINNTISDYQ
jgi:hypothetical protein